MGHAVRLRKGRSTAQALYACRRILDSAEGAGNSVILTLLDWEKAFDKVDQTRMLDALTRLGIPSKMVKVLRSVYTNLQFRAKYNEEVAEYKTQHSGIRQGCPLSPYLFVLLMTVLFNEVHNDLDTMIRSERVDHINFTEILYADDTLLITKKASALNKFIAGIETESAFYSMTLNKGTCEVITMGCSSNVHFSDGARLNSVTEATYLGGTITQAADAKTEVEVESPLRWVW